jgi:cell division septation protein DedD
MQEDFKQSNHISYKEYQKKVTKNPNEGIAIFVSAFFILLLLFLGIAKQISPEIDVSIGEENSKAAQDADDDKSAVDERLKLLQMEDNGDNTFAPELDEKVVIPDRKNSTEKTEEEVVKLPDNEAKPTPAETASPAPQVSKVVVGYYATKEQAEVAMGIIAESGLNVTPFVRSIGGAYTIQVGSYTTREKAQSVANDLLRNNYPARIISE